MSGLENFRPIVMPSPVSLEETSSKLFLGTDDRRTLKRGKTFILRKPKPFPSEDRVHTVQAPLMELCEDRGEGSHRSSLCPLSLLSALYSPQDFIAAGGAHQHTLFDS